MLDISLKIEGMSCAGCASSIERAMASIEGVGKSHVNFATKTAFFEIHSMGIEKLIQSKITEMGYSIHSIPDEKTVMIW